MSSRYRLSSIGAVLTIALGLGSPLVASDETPTILVVVANHAAVSSRTLDGAKQEVSRIYAAIHVSVTWTREVTARPMSQLVIIIAPTTQEWMAPETLGLTMRGTDASSRVAYVFYDHVQSLARKYQMCEGSILGAAIAHEIGHLLLPYGSHSPSGLMKAVWDTRQFFLARAGLLWFTTEQATLIRSHLMDSPDHSSHD